MQPTTQLVLGLGNTLRGDDGAGAAVIEALDKRADVPADVRLVDGGTPGLETVLILQGCARVIIVDAAAMGLAPGAWARFNREDAKLRGTYGGLRGTLHGAGLAEALELGAALGILPGEIIIYGIQPHDVDWSVGLSEEVRRVLPDVCSAIIDDLKG